MPDQRSVDAGPLVTAPRDRRPVSLSAGWRLVTGLAALAAVMGILVTILSIARGGDDRPHPSATRPWASCVQEVRHQLAPLRGIQVLGPIETVWEPSGGAVELLGALRDAPERDRPFACRAIALGGAWVVERVMFGR